MGSWGRYEVRLRHFFLEAGSEVSESRNLGRFVTYSGALKRGALTTVYEQCSCGRTQVEIRDRRTDKSRVVRIL